MNNLFAVVVIALGVTLLTVAISGQYASLTSVFGIQLPGMEVAAGSEINKGPVKQLSSVQPGFGTQSAPTSPNLLQGV